MQNIEVTNHPEPSVIWVQLMDFLVEYGKHMKTTYAKRMRNDSQITWDDIEDANKQIRDKIDYLMSWSERNCSEEL